MSTSLIISPVTEINIQLQPKQRDALTALESWPGLYMLYGGAKFGGKSFLVRAKEVIRRLKYPGTVGVIIRKTYPELLSNHIRRFFIDFPITRQWWKASEKAIYYPNGSITEFRHLSGTNDVYNYQGIEYDDITVDEITQHEEEVFKVLKTSLRQDPKVKAANPNYRPKVLLTGNPGGVGHGFVQRLFVDRAFQQGETEDDYRFIQARFYDNPIGVAANPDYLRNLQDLPEALRKAYLDGDWNIFAGQYFKRLDPAKHLVEPFNIPPWWHKFRSMDWGYAHNTCVLWWAVSPEGIGYVYRDYLDNEKTPRTMARSVVDATGPNEDIAVTLAGTDVFNRLKEAEHPAHKTIADLMEAEGLYLDKAVTDRVQGWQLMQEWLDWNDAGKKPRIQVFNTSERIYRGWGRLIHDKRNPEDVLKMDGDDEGDAGRYGVHHLVGSVQPQNEKSEQEQFIEKITTPAGDTDGWDDDI